MHISYAKVTLRMPYVHSLKQKRQIIQSIKGKLRHRFAQLMVAEVEHHDQWQLTTLAIAAINYQRRPLESFIGQVINYWQHELFMDAEIIDIQQQTITTD
ncbi:MAG: DUF503 family protein [Legionellales bacterium]|nr:DUF503 family protein [Legionellales bacterium]